MKTKIMITLLTLTTLTAQAAPTCDEHQVRTYVKNSISTLVGRDAGGGNTILKIENINVLTTEDNKGNIKALFSFDETIGKTVKDSTEFKMLGYVVVQRATCQQVDGVMLGSAPLPR
jgi:hypothetical protein